ncbi:HET-domain-containing protein, partial [Hyaloscypha hepaticicola]
IRLLRLLPRRNLSDPNELIRCELSPAQLNDANTRYTAISYMWGTRDADRVIELDRASFSVTENLWACLRKFRNLIPGETSLSYIWVDAICINQEDPDERSSQVSQMGAIYAEAQKVVI